MGRNIFRREQIMRILKIICGISGIIFIGFGIYSVKYIYWYKARIVEDVYIAQRPFENIYDIFSRRGKFRIYDTGNANGWIIQDNYMYGSAVDPKFYIIDLKNLIINKFYKENEFNERLLKYNLPPLDMSTEENISDLQQRKRIYPSSIKK